jgi:hypothetical protein
MPSLPIVEPFYECKQRAARLVMGPVGPATQKFTLQGGKKALGQRVIVTRGDVRTTWKAMKMRHAHRQLHSSQTDSRAAGLDPLPQDPSPATCADYLPPPKGARDGKPQAQRRGQRHHRHQWAPHARKFRSWAGRRVNCRTPALLRHQRQHNSSRLLAPGIR